MARSRSRTSSNPCADLHDDPRARWRRTGRTLGAALAVLCAGLALRGEPADACGWDGPLPEDLTTFDPQLVEEPGAEAVAYDPTREGFDEACAPCAIEAQRADWRGYLRGAVTDDDWQQVLLRATPAELTALANHLDGKRAPVPAPYATSSLWQDASARPRLRAALALVKLARQVEVFAGAAEPTGELKLDPAEHARRRAALLATAKASARAAKDPFLRQRYAFQVVKLTFYLRAWDQVVAAFDQQAKALAGPSQDLSWRARYYAAGALMRSGRRARGNLELARIHAGYGPLAGAAANDFRPMEESDWRDSLRLARTPHEQAALWRLVGVTRDGVVAMREIIKLEPTSPLLAALAVRELERAEAGSEEVPRAGKRQLLEVPDLEQLATQLAALPGADRPWLMQLVAGHLAAKRGDLEVARTRLAAAQAARPDDARVQRQARASLALALVLDRKMVRPSAARSEEIARAMRDVDERFPRLGRLRREVRGNLAAAYADEGAWAEGELLRPGTLEDHAAAASKWQDVAFLRALIARARRASSLFDRFLLEGSYTVAQLEQELALRYLNQGNFAEAAKVFAAGVATSSHLGVDPFVLGILDCHDCDHARYAEAPWTHASFAARLVELERVARGRGEPAAQAALTIGNALYNLSWFGNARVVLQDSHQTQASPVAAERWYKRAYQLSRDRELRAKAAFFAAKVELGRLLAAEQASDRYDAFTVRAELPVPKTWFPAVENLADTRYYREVLAECSNFAAWASRPR